MRIRAPRRFVAWLVERAKRNPIDPILGSDGSVYMERYTLYQRKFLWVRIHILKRGDEDPNLHDHPWRNVSWILENEYVEQLAHRSIVRKTGKIIYRGLHVKHRIDLRVDAKGQPISCTSMFIAGRWAQGWGFYVNGTKVPWRDYLANNGNRVAAMKQARQTKRNV